MVIHTYIHTYMYFHSSSSYIQTAHTYVRMYFKYCYVCRWSSSAACWTSTTWSTSLSSCKSTACPPHTRPVHTYIHTYKIMLTNILNSLVVVWLIGFADENQYIIALCLLIEQQKPLLEAEKKGTYVCMYVCMYALWVNLTYNSYCMCIHTLTCVSYK